MNEYSYGDDRSSFEQPGTYVPIIGDGNSAQRIAWRLGTDDNNINGVYQQENDLQVMLATDTAAAAAAAGRSGGADLHFIDDGIGNTIAAATPLPLTGNKVNPTLAAGVITPNSESNPTPMGVANYTVDYFSFSSNGTTAITLNVNDGSDHFVSGTVDDDGTLRSTLNIYLANGTLVAAATEAASTEVDTYTGTLPAGTYYAAIGSYGGHQQVNAADYDPAYYFDTGDFFLTGSGFATATTNSAPVVTLNPANQTVPANTPATFTAAAAGTPAPTVQWQVSNDGGATYTNIAGATKTTLLFGSSQSGAKVRAVFTNSLGTATTTAATLTVTGAAVAPSITTFPKSQSDTVGTPATFTATATGTPTPTVQWSVSTDGGTTYTPIAGATNTTLTVVPAAAGTFKYKVVFSNSAGSASTVATLTVTKPVVVLGTVNGEVFKDLTGNSTSADDTGLAGVAVSLYTDTNKNGVLDAADKLVSTTKTLTDGTYAFSGLAAGQYLVTQTVPAGYVRTAPLLVNYVATTVTTGSTSAAAPVIFDDFLKPTSLGVTNVSFKTAGTSFATLMGGTKNGQTLSVTFTVTNPLGEELSLVSYNAPSGKFDAATAAQQKVFKSSSAFYKPGTYTISITLPPTGHYQVDFVVGDVITNFGPAGSNLFYTPQGRIIATDTE